MRNVVLQNHRESRIVQHCRLGYSTYSPRLALRTLYKLLGLLFVVVRALTRWSRLFFSLRCDAILGEEDPRAGINGSSFSKPRHSRSPFPSSSPSSSSSSSSCRVKDRHLKLSESSSKETSRLLDRYFPGGRVRACRSRRKRTEKEW